MINNLRQKYKVEKSNVEKAFEYQLALKENKEYEERVDNTFLQIVTFFVKTNPNVKIAPPQGREKSKKSLKKKIENLEIERLCKLYVIEGLTEGEKIELFSMILKNTQGRKKAEIKVVALKEIQDLKAIEKIIEDEEIEEKTKTALLRIIKTRIEEQNRPNKQELLEELEYRYGETAAIRTNKLANNLLKWDSIEKECKNDEASLDKLHEPFEYLTTKDLRGFEIIIADVPKDIETQNEELKHLLQERENVDESQKTIYNDKCCTTLANDFANRLMKNEELLQELNIRILPNGYKHKEKQNGYLAEHIKFCYIDHPEYTFEFQIRSMYREDLTRANGIAAHDKRSGKKRIFPSVGNKEKFIQELEDTIPKYRILTNRKGTYELQKCPMTHNMLEYFLGFIKLDSKEYKKALQYLQEENLSKGIEKFGNFDK